MKRGMLLLVFLLLSFSITIVSAQEMLSEQVKCVFLNLDTAQKCYTDDGKFSCSGIGSCLVEVSGGKDQQLRWKSSCSGEASTFIDGTDNTVEFKCEPAAIPKPAQPVLEEVREKIKCVFLNSASIQKCYTIDGKFSCSAIESCEMEIYGGKGTTPSWKSSCSGEFSTLLDGAGEEYQFKCEQAQPAPTPPPVTEMVKENIRCLFANSNSLQKCYTNDGKFSCSGTDGCEVWVSGEKEKSLNWKSSCGGYFSTTLNGGTKDLTFKCEPAAPQPTTPQPAQPIPAPFPIITPPSTEQTKEVVKCIFTDSDSGQFCYTDDKRFGCKGIGTCVVELYGKPGERLSWRSSCEGSVSTLVDGLTDYIAFKCAQVSSPQPTPTQPVPALPTVKERVKCLFVNAQTPQFCVNEYPDSGCKGIGSCIDENVVGEQGKKMVWKSSCGGGYAYTVMDGEDEYVEFICPQSPTPSTAQEQITCLFANADTPQKCYTDDEKYTCSSAGEFYTRNIDGQEVKYPLCRIDVSGAQGQKLTWKSSCGNYAYTVVDGNAEDAEFSCIPSAEVSKEQIGGQGFKKAYWQCYDGLEKPSVVSVSVDCQSSEAWQKEAGDFCQNHCKEYPELGITKCGVNSFSVNEYCYLEYGKEGVEFVPPEPEHTYKEETPREGFFVPGDGTLLYFYTDACRPCQGMDKVLEAVGSKLGVSVGFIDFANRSYYGTLFEKMDITAVPTIVYKRSDERFIKRVGEADASTIINWLTGKEEALVGEPLELPKEKKEELLFCKDSCPREGKCYPFGYRKEGRFCSDFGAFTEQLSGDSLCDNNFECKSNVCVSGKCISSGLLDKILGWFKRLFGGEEAKEEAAKIIDCGVDTACMENAFKTCQPAKLSQSGGPISEIVIMGLEDEKCVMKMAAGTESMVCKFENYALGTQNIGAGSMEQYCSGTLTYRLAAAPKMMKQEKPAYNSVVNALKLSADPNNPRYSFTVHDSDGIREFRIIKSDFGEVAVKAEPPCAKDFTTEFEFKPSDLPLKAMVEDCGTPVIRQELNVDIQTPVEKET